MARREHTERRLAERAAWSAAGKASVPRDPVTGTATLLVGLGVCAVLLYKNVLGPQRGTVAPMDFTEYYLFNLCLLLLPPLATIFFVCRREVADFGLKKGELKAGLIAALLGALAFIPVLLIVAPSRDFQSYYLWMLQSSGVLVEVVARGDQLVGGKIDWGRLAFHELILGTYMLAWEWFFRGFLLLGLRRIMPFWAAALLQAALFCALHWSKPLAEVGSSFLGGLVLAGVVWRFQSILPCFLVHFLISASNDGAALYFHFRATP